MENWGATLRGLRSPRALVDLALAAALWLLLAGSLHLQEVVAGVLVGLGVAVVGIRVRAEVDHRPATVARHLRTVARQHLGAHRDSWLLTVALLRRPVARPPVGGLRVVPFTFGDASPEAVGRRLVTTLGASLRPNSYVVGFDREQGVVLVHQLIDDGQELVPSALVRPRDPERSS